MTYFSDFETVDYYDNYSSRYQILKQHEDIVLRDFEEHIPEDLLEEFDDPS
jgi:hypothetical protein